MKDSVDEHKEWLDKLDALETMIEATLRNSRTEQQHIFRDEFKTLLQQLPQQLKRILAEQGSKNLTPAASARGNQQRMLACAKKAPTLAESVSKDLKDHVLNSVLDVLHTRFHDLQERVCREVHHYFVAVAENLETRDFERLEAFAVSQRHARFCAGLIAAIHSSPLRTMEGASLFADFEGLDDILELAKQPPGLIKHGEGLEALRMTTELVLATGADVEAMETDATEWHCPNCHVSLRNTNPNASGALSRAQTPKARRTGRATTSCTPPQPSSRTATQDNVYVSRKAGGAPQGSRQRGPRPQRDEAIRHRARPSL